MNTHNSNIEAVARHICAQQMESVGSTGADLETAIDRYWHCVAAELEAGLIDECGNRLVPHEFHRDLGAYRDWRHRHPAEQVS